MSQWVKIGANVSNFQFSPVAILFHLSFGAILVLYALYWLQLNIFEVLTYLTPLLVLLTFTGHYTLEALASARNKAKKSD